MIFDSGMIWVVITLELKVSEPSPTCEMLFSLDIAQMRIEV